MFKQFVSFIFSKLYFKLLGNSEERDLKGFSVVVGSDMVDVSVAVGVEDDVFSSSFSVTLVYVVVETEAGTVVDIWFNPSSIFSRSGLEVNIATVELGMESSTVETFSSGAASINICSVVEVANVVDNWEEGFKSPSGTVSVAGSVSIWNISPNGNNVQTLMVSLIENLWLKLMKLLFQ